jgi:hypothetical protein
LITTLEPGSSGVKGLLHLRPRRDPRFAEEVRVAACKTSISSSALLADDGAQLV